MRKRAQRRTRRDPEQTLRRILWLAEQAERDEGAREVLHDALLSAHDVRLSSPLIAVQGGQKRLLRTLADKYESAIGEAEHEAEISGQKQFIIVSPHLKMMPVRILPLSGTRSSTGTLVYTTRAGRR